jgi:hypothetical protein
VLEKKGADFYWNLDVTLFTAVPQMRYWVAWEGMIFAETFWDKVTVKPNGQLLKWANGLYYTMSTLKS